MPDAKNRLPSGRDLCTRALANMASTGLARKDPSTPVNVNSLAGSQPELQITNNGGQQLSKMSVSADPETTLSNNTNLIAMVFDPLREEDVLQRRLRCETEALTMPKQIDLQAA